MVAWALEKIWMITALCYNEMKGKVTSKQAEDSVSSLLERAKNGEQRAIDLLCAKYWLPLFRYAYSLTANKQEAEDLVQEAFYRVLDHLPNIQSDQGNGFFSYLRVTLRHIAIDRFRSQGDYTFALLDEEKLTADSSWEDSLCEEETFNYLRACIKELPSEWRNIIYLRFTCKWSVKKISHFLGYSPRMIKQIENDILLTLRNKLREKGLLELKDEK